MNTQQQIKDLYSQEMRDYWKTDKMTNYCIKKAAYFVGLDDGNYLVLEKPDIETSFCFGYGYCGISDEEDYQNARAMEDHARTSENYFLRENLKGIDARIADLKDETLEAYTYNQYMGQRADTHLRSYTVTDTWHNPEYEPYRWNYTNLRPMTDTERAALIAGLEEVRKAFVKRLNTYLKRYGLSKLKTWTYLSD